MVEVLKAPGSVTVSSATAFAREIEDALARNDELALDLEAVEELDLSFVQTVHAARDLASRSDKTLRLAPSVPAAVRQLLERAGFLTSPAQADLDFWFNGAAPR